MQIGRDRESIRKQKDCFVPVDVEQRLRRGEFEKLSVLPEPIEAAGAQFVEAILRRLSVLMFQRKEHVVARAFRLREHGLCDMIDRVFLNAAPALRAERST